ncbi:hypothetical protein [Geodermatophilus tzadiensis]|uniref:hypothetical protein n=1 Tax=Geodermatophilus tzadiensis TaxID=1137988 RepID=UPI0011B23AF8|nr:hypothetical protein [Geodermatophilus tzadiensis]
MFRWVCAAVAGAVLSGFAFLLVTGRYANDGPVILQLGAGHGLHRGDLFVATGWAVAMVMLAVLAWPHRRPVSRADRPGPSR